MSDSVSDGYAVDPESPMPAWLQLRHHELCEFAGECYGLRNAALRTGDDGYAQACEEVGDVALGRALAINVEFEERVGDNPAVMYGPAAVTSFRQPERKPGGGWR